METSRKIAIMQPYFFPYIGYWQLIKAVDVFVIYDVGKYIPHGWMHRNRVLGFDGVTPLQIDMTVSKASYNKAIFEMQRLIVPQKARKLEATLQQRYRKAPYYDEAMKVIKPIIYDSEPDLVKYLTRLLKDISSYQGLETRFALASEVPLDGLEHVEDRLFKICDWFGIKDYVNPIGGTQFYDKEVWKERGGVNLSFLKRDDDISYRQFKYDFVPDLSIIDVMMFNSREEIAVLLDKYTLL